ncbi:MAG: hypothetical protein ACMXYA_02125 [Candidatus Woesearchaeota archaeon]
MAKNITDSVDTTQAFYFSSDICAKSVKELQDILLSSKQYYDNHVNPEKNDFANWIEHVFEQKDVADHIRQTESYHELLDYFTIILHEEDTNTDEDIILAKNTVEKKKDNLKKIKHHITQLENETSHLTKYNHTKSKKPILDKDVDIKDHLVDFALGFSIGIILGFILARGLGF